MKKFGVLLILAVALLCFACGQKTKKEETTNEASTEKVAELKFPEGYPQEETLPEGFTPNNISEGEGSVSGGGMGERTYKSFKIEKMMPQNRAEMVMHYRTLTEEQEWQGNWDIFDDGLGATGTFTKGNMELEVKITDMIFNCKVKVYND